MSRWETNMEDVLKILERERGVREDLIKQYTDEEHSHISHAAEKQLAQINKAIKILNEHVKL